MNWTDNLDESKQFVDVNKLLHPTNNLDMTLFKPAGEAKQYFWFLYLPKKIWDHPQGKVLVSMNADQINVNKQVNNQRR